MTKFRLTSSSFLLCLCLSACLTPTGNQKPAEVVRYGGRSGAGSTGLHTVLNGDTVYTVSQRYNLPLRDIISVNHLSPPYKLQSGFRIKLPPPNEYRVRAADSLSSISRLFGVSVNETARLNNIPAPYALKAGQVLRLPTAQPQLKEAFAAAPSDFAFTAESETLTQPLKVAGVEAEELPPPPGMGQSGAKASSSPNNKAASLSAYPPQPAAKITRPADKTAEPSAKVEKVAAVTQSIAPKIPARAGGGKFMRPVDGKTISGFGPKEGGLHNDGINIKAPRGTAVRAADNGVVAYVGNEMQGYGNLVLIRHEGRWMTAYAHMDKTLVKKGDVVKAGQSIGTVGSTGQVDAPQLHFEIRRGTEAQNPGLYL